MKLRRRRFLNVIAAVEAVRAAHPELAHPMRLLQLERVLARERIGVMRMPIDETAYTIGALGSYVIVVNSSLYGRHYSRVVAHEYAHIKLHRSHHEIEFQTKACERGDPREYEAELFVMLLRLGPTATPEHPDVARLIGKLEAPSYVQRTPAQLPLELPEAPPTFARQASPTEPPAAAERIASRAIDRADLERAYTDALGHDRAQWTKRRPRKFSVTPGAPLSEDLVRIKFYDETMRASRFVDRDGRWWWMYNYKVETDANGRRHRVRVRDFMSRDIEYRVFMNSLGQPRVYRFADRREGRDYRVKHLERQLAEATPLRRNSSSVLRLRHSETK